MTKFRLNSGTHFDQGREYSKGDIIESNSDLEKVFRNKFTKIDVGDTNDEKKSSKKSRRSRSRTITNTESEKERPEKYEPTPKYESKPEEDGDGFQVFNPETGEVLANHIPEEDIQGTLDALNKENPTDD